jgi:lysophospholipase L1-like esterase
MNKPLLFFLAVLPIAGVLHARQVPATAPTQNTAGNCPDSAALQKEIDHLNDYPQDWPQLNRYRDANAALSPSAPGEARVVFMGDSITDMWQEPRFGGFFPGKPYIDRGISGQTTPQMLLRFRADVTALQPQVVVILAGTNDIAGNTGPMTLQETEDNLASMSELAHAHGIRVVLASVTPVADMMSPDGKKIVQTVRRPPEKILSLNEWIKKYAAEHDNIYLDYFPAMVDDHGFLKTALTDDGLHPNAAGYAVMAPLAEKAITQALSNFSRK